MQPLRGLKAPQEQVRIYGSTHYVSPHGTNSIVVTSPLVNTGQCSQLSQNARKQLDLRIVNESGR